MTAFKMIRGESQISSLQTANTALLTLARCDHSVIILSHSVLNKRLNLCLCKIIA